MRNLITVKLGTEEPRNLRAGDIIPLGNSLFKVRNISKVPYGYQSKFEPKDNLYAYALQLDEVFNLKEWDENGS